MSMFNSQCPVFIIKAPSHEHHIDFRLKCMLAAFDIICNFWIRLICSNPVCCCGHLIKRKIHIQWKSFLLSSFAFLCYTIFSWSWIIETHLHSRFNKTGRAKVNFFAHTVVDVDETFFFFKLRSLLCSFMFFLATNLWNHLLPGLQTSFLTHLPGLFWLCTRVDLCFSHSLPSTE